MATEVKVPDIGDFDDVPVIAILVEVGDVIEKEDPLIELESDKATMEVPSSHAGKVTEIKVKEGDGVAEGSVGRDHDALAMLEPGEHLELPWRLPAQLDGAACGRPAIGGDDVNPLAAGIGVEPAARQKACLFGVAELQAEPDRLAAPSVGRGGAPEH